MDNDSRHDDDPWRDDTAREAQLSEQGQRRFVQLERRCLRAVRVDEPLNRAAGGRRTPAPRHSFAYSESEMTPTLALTTDMLEWLAEEPRSYAETLDVWKTSCPRLSIWEDALADGLIRIEAGTRRLRLQARRYCFKR